MTQSEHHIASAFDRDLRNIETLVSRMGAMAEQSIQMAVRSLVTRDAEGAKVVISDDRRIDALEEEIYLATTRVLALRAPAAGDLRFILAAIKIAGNLERLGDYSKNLAKRTSALNQMPEIEGVTGVIRRMAVDVQSMLTDVLEAFLRRDAALAEDVRRRDIEVDQMYNTVFRSLLTHMIEDHSKIAPGMHLHFISKNIERMGDHVTSIADQLIYCVSGRLPDEDRPKSDTTSLVVDPVEKGTIS